MTEQTILSVTAIDVTYTITAPDGLTCTDFIRYCVHLAKAQGYLLPNIAEALEDIHDEIREEQMLSRHTKR